MEKKAKRSKRFPSRALRSGAVHNRRDTGSVRHRNVRSSQKLLAGPSHTRAHCWLLLRVAPSRNRCQCVEPFTTRRSSSTVADDYGYPCPLRIRAQFIPLGLPALFADPGGHILSWKTAFAPAHTAYSVSKETLPISDNDCYTADASNHD